MTSTQGFNMALWISAAVLWTIVSVRVLFWIYDGITYLKSLPDLLSRIHSNLNQHDSRINALDNKFDFIEDNKHTLKEMIRIKHIEDHRKSQSKGRRK
jgi:hypothetical protein